MPGDWWDARTLTGSELIWTPAKAVWIRFRLADALNRRFWASQGVRIKWSFFEPKDGDQYAQPLVRTDCRQGPASFGDLGQRGVWFATAGREYPWAGQAEFGKEYPYEGRDWPDWASYFDAVVRELGLDRLTPQGHEHCVHARPGSIFPDVFLLAMLVRTRLGSAIDSGRWMDEQDAKLVAGPLVSTHPHYASLAAQNGTVLALRQGFDFPEPLLAFQLDGTVVTPTGALDVNTLLEPHIPPSPSAPSRDPWLAAASRLQAAMTVVQPQGGHSWPSDHVASLRTLQENGLPLNRKERFYTGTVLPALITTNDFEHLNRFTELAGLGQITVTPDPQASDFQLFTEYSLGESAFTYQDKARFAHWSSHEAPDLVLWLPGAGALLAVEAKMFHRPTPGQLGKQLQRQRELLDRIAQGIAPRPSLIRQAVLVAEPYLDEISAVLSEHVIPMTWEALADCYRGTAPPYWIGILDEALSQWHDLCSTTWPPGTPPTMTRSGAKIRAMAQLGQLDGWYMGRRGGLGTFLQDVQLAHWEQRSYPLMNAPVLKKDWFPVVDALALAASQQV